MRCDGPHDTGQLTKKIIWNITNESVLRCNSQVERRPKTNARIKAWQESTDSLKLESKYLQSALQIFL